MATKQKKVLFSLMDRAFFCGFPKQLAFYIKYVLHRFPKERKIRAHYRVPSWRKHRNSGKGGNASEAKVGGSGQANWTSDSKNTLYITVCVNCIKMCFLMSFWDEIFFLYILKELHKTFLASKVIGKITHFIKPYRDPVHL